MHRFTPFSVATNARILASAWALATVVALAPVGVAFLVSPEDIESGRIVLSPTCPIKRATGRECPSCGMTRAFAALGHGRLADALAYNRGAPVVLLVCALLAILGPTRAARAMRASRARAGN